MVTEICKCGHPQDSHADVRNKETGKARLACTQCLCGDYEPVSRENARNLVGDNTR